MYISDRGQVSGPSPARRSQAVKELIEAAESEAP